MPATAFSVDDLAAAPSPCGRRRKSPPCPRFASLRWRQPPSQPPALSRSRPTRARPPAARAPTRTRAWAAASSASGVAATIAPTAAPSVRDGHVDGWVGVGGPGLGPNGTDEWIQIGLTSVPNDSLNRIYYEIQRPGRPVVYRELRSNVAVGHAAPVRRPRARRRGRTGGASGSTARPPPHRSSSRQATAAGRRRPSARAGPARRAAPATPTPIRSQRQIRERRTPGRLEPVPPLPAVPGPELPAGAALRLELPRPQRRRSGARVGRDEPVTRTGRPRGRPVLHRQGW